MKSAKHLRGLALALALALAVGLGLSGCSKPTPDGSRSGSAGGSAVAAAPASVTIKSLNATKEAIDLEVPYDARRVAVMDLAALDILDNLGLGDRVVGASQNSLDYLADYNGGQVANLGTVKEADLEAVAAAQPDVIFIGGRLARLYDELSQIAPVVYLATDSEKGVVESTREMTETIAAMFGKEDEVDELMSGFQQRADALKAASAGSTALVGMYTSGGFNVLGSDGRASLITNEAGFSNIADDEVTATHGNEVSFETVVEKDPAYIFVLNRDAAIGRGSEEGAKDVIENELTRSTTAYRDGHIVYLEHPGVWYMAEGGVTALDVMLSDLEGPLGVK